MKAFILTAGLGTRLRPLTLTQAKPSFPVLGVPLLWHWAKLLHEQLGVTEIAVNIHHCPESVLAVLKDPDLLSTIPVKFHISDETQELLGSSGCLWNLRNWLGTERLIIVNGDTLARIDLRKLEKTHQKMKGQMTLALLRMPDGNQTEYTTVEMDSFQRILGFGPKRKEGLMYCGVSIVEGRALEALPDGPSDMMKTLLSPLSIARELFGVEFQSPLLDIGNPQAYFNAHFEVLNDFPEFQNSAGIKMRKIPQGFIPRNWPAAADAWLEKNANGPLVLYGDFESWKTFCEKNGATLGPHLLGIKPNAAPVTEKSFCNAILFGKEKIEVNQK